MKNKLLNVSFQTTSAICRLNILRTMQKYAVEDGNLTSIKVTVSMF